jgi:hypothetical protein
LPQIKRWALVNDERKFAQSLRVIQHFADAVIGDNAAKQPRPDKPHSRTLS